MNMMMMMMMMMMKPLSVGSSPAAYKFLYLRFIYTPQYSALKHKQILFFPGVGSKFS
jgi:hypothetical protein